MQIYGLFEVNYARYGSEVFDYDEYETLNCVSEDIKTLVKYGNSVVDNSYFAYVLDMTIENMDNDPVQLANTCHLQIRELEVI